MGILLCAKSFLGTPDLLTTYKAFIPSLMEYSSFLWAGAPASHLSQLHTMETKAFMIIGISHDEAESLVLSLSHCRQVGGLSVFYSFLSSLAPPALSAICPTHISAGCSWSASNPLLDKTTKIKNHCSPSLFHSSFFLPFWNKLPHTLQSHSSLQVFKTAVHHHLLSSPIQNHDLFYPH